MAKADLAGLILDSNPANKPLVTATDIYIDLKPFAILPPRMTQTLYLSLQIIHPCPVQTTPLTPFNSPTCPPASYGHRCT
jgi:hypothetical protein